MSGTGLQPPPGSKLVKRTQKATIKKKYPPGTLPSQMSVEELAAKASTSLSKLAAKSAPPKSLPPPPPRVSKIAKPPKDVGKVRPSTSTEPQRPSLLQKRVFKEALSKSALDPKSKVKAVGSQRSTMPAPKVKTKRGRETVVQQLTMETTVQRSPKAEYVAKTMKGIDVDPKGKARKLEITSQQIDPAYATESAGVNETVSKTSSITVTASGKQLKKSYKKRTVMAKGLMDKPNMNPVQINRLVKEENEDVENMLKMAPPALVSPSIDKYPLKKKLQNLRFNSESMAILQQSVIYPPPTADEVETEAPPEVMANVIHAVEGGVVPTSAPNQIFNTLFPKAEDETMIPLSSVAPGPLQDIVIPLGPPPKMTDEILTEEMEQSLADIQAIHELPATDVVVESKIEPIPPEDKSEKKLPMLLETEIPPWENENVQRIAPLVGGDPIELLEPTDVSILEEDLTKELSKGVDYFLDANVNPYETRVQIRGSKLPHWFPGYMVALPHYPELVKISKCPNAVLNSAWKAVQPKIFSEDSLLIV